MTIMLDRILDSTLREGTQTPGVIFSPEEKILEFLGNKDIPPQIISGGIGSNYVVYNISLLHPFDKHRFGLVTNSRVWPEIEIIAELGIWDGKINRFDVIPQEIERANFPMKKDKENK